MSKVLFFESHADAEETLPLGEIKKLKIEGKEICATRTNEGIFAFEKNCPHRGFALELGHINGEGEVVCPFHTFRFSLKTGEESFQQCNDLTVFDIYAHNGKLFINF